MEERERVFYCVPCYTLKLEPHEQLTHSKIIEFISKHRRKWFFPAGRGAWPMAPVLASAFSSFRLDVAPVGPRSSHTAPGSWPMSACAVPLPLRPVPELSASGPRSHLGLDSGDGQYWPQHRVGREGPGLGWAGLRVGDGVPRWAAVRVRAGRPSPSQRQGQGPGGVGELRSREQTARTALGRPKRHTGTGSPRSPGTASRGQLPEKTGHRRPLQNKL